MTSNNQEFENINFKCISLNVRGLNKSRKRRKIFRWLHQQNAQIVLLQETYSTKKVENKWKTEWVGQMLFSHGSNHSKGVMILIKPSFDIEIKRSVQDKQGRCIILEAKVYESNFIFVNIYAPNDCTHQMIFYKSLQERLKKFSNENLVIGGDFNCVLSSLDKKGGKPASEKIRVTNEIQRTMTLFNLHDAWRDLFPEQIGFTWRDNALKVQSRLDYFLVSKQLKPIICYCDIIFAPFTDHSAVTLQIRTKDCQQKKGPGFWKFNSSLLIDNKYVESLRACIAKSKTKYEYLENKGLKWNLIKMEIRAFSIRFSKKKAKLKRTEEKDTLEAINNLQKQLDKDHLNKMLKQKLYAHKQKLGSLLHEKIKRTILRSKVRWYEDGKHNCKYFLNLEKRNQIQKCVSKLQISDTETIINVRKLLYPRLQCTSITNRVLSIFHRFTAYYNCIR